MTVITNIADATAAELNAANFSQPVSTERHDLPQFELPEMKTLHVTAAPMGVESIDLTTNTCYSSVCADGTPAP